MKHARLFSLLVMVLAIFYGGIGFFFLPYASFQGDLTRMAMLPEAQFGWRKPQPPVDAEFIKQSPMAEADVLVVGDSFSDNPEFHSLVWQSAFTRRGLKVRTESWSSIRAICSDFMPWLKAQGFQGKVIILEIVERNLASGLKKSVACEHMQSHLSVAADRLRRPPLTSFDPMRTNWDGRFSIGIRARINLYEYEHLRATSSINSISLPHGTNVTRVTNGCDLFSHKSCNDSLFLSEDSPQDIDSRALDDISALNERMSGIHPVWVVVPNKSTAYLYPEKKFWSEAAQRFNFPDLLHMTQTAIDQKVVDLYPANNTHFSTEGYLLMGEEIFQATQRALTSSK